MQSIIEDDLLNCRPEFRKSLITVLIPDYEAEAREQPTVTTGVDSMNDEGQIRHDQKASRAFDASTRRTKGMFAALLRQAAGPSNEDPSS